MTDTPPTDTPQKDTPQTGAAKTGAGKTDQVQGEGDYVAGRRFQDAEQAFVKTGPVEEKAREAADALDGPEADDLEKARLSTAQGADELGKPKP